jgi:predicted RNase H-like HicB family nuclease
MNAEVLLRLPWTWNGPREVREEGVTYWVAEINELEGFVVAGETREAVEQDRLEALEEFLQSYVDKGEMPPLPGWKMTVPEGGADATSRPFDFTSVDATVADPDLQTA